MLSRHRRFVLLCAATALVPATRTWAGGHVTASWVEPVSGTWTDSTRWSTNPHFPNNGNGGVDYGVSLNATGAPYTVMLDGNIAVTELHLSSPDATLWHRGGVLNIGTTTGGSIFAGPGRYLLDGGTVARAAVFGHLTYSSNRNNTLTDGTYLFNGLRMLSDGGYVKFANNATFAGNATVLGEFATFAFEYPATIGGRTINLDGRHAAMETTHGNVLTLAASARVRGNGEIRAHLAAGAGGLLNHGRITADIERSGDIGVMLIEPTTVTNTGTVAAVNRSMADVRGHVTNTGTFYADNGAIVSAGTGGSLVHAGTALIAGGSIRFDGTWRNDGTVTINGGTFALAGTFTTAGIGLPRVARNAGSINHTGFLDNASGTLPVTPATGDWLMSFGGTISGGTVTQNDGARLVFGPGPSGFINTLTNGAVLEGGLLMSRPSGTARFQNDATFLGDGTLSGANVKLYFGGSSAALDDKTIHLVDLGSFSNAQIIVENNATLTLGPNMVIRGRGNVGNDVLTGTSLNNTVVNHGRIVADLPDRGFGVNPRVLINHGTIEAVNTAAYIRVAAPSLGGSFTNHGVMRAAASTVRIGETGGLLTWTNAPDGRILANLGELRFDGRWSNAGTIDITNATLWLDGSFTTAGLGLPRVFRSGGEITIASELDNRGATLDLSAQHGAWRFPNFATINGGTITEGSGGGRLLFRGGILKGGAVFDGDLPLDGIEPAGAELHEGSRFTGNALLASADSATLVYAYGGTLGSGQTIFMESGAARARVHIRGPVALTVETGAEIVGSGTIDTGTDSTAGGMLVNRGTIRNDRAGETLTVRPFSMFNFGALAAVSKATLHLDTHAQNFFGARFIARGGGKLLIDDIEGRIYVGELDGTGSVMRISGTYATHLPVAVTHGATLHLRGTWTKAHQIDASGFVIFDYEDAGASPFDALRAQVVAGYNGGSWFVPENITDVIVSTAAAATPGTGVGYAEASAVLGPVGGTFGGEGVDGTEVLMRFTRYGDANLDGTVNLQDFNRLAANFGGSNKVWHEGDFNYDEAVNLVDFNRLAANFGLSAAGPTVTPADWAALASAVPEPCSAAGLVAAGMGVLLRRRAHGRRATEFN
jgi:hypothetical protein